MTTLIYLLARDPQAAGDDTRSVATDTILSFATALIGYPHIHYRELTRSDSPFPVVSLFGSETEISDELTDRIARNLQARGVQIRNIGEDQAETLC
jgi:hypothetical protein